MNKKYFEKVKGESSFLISLILVNLTLAILNRNSHMMGGLLDYYIDFKNVISHNFDQNYSKMKAPTFPMWGYGWLFLFTMNKSLIYFLQFLLSSYTLLEVIFYLKKYENLSSIQIKMFKFLLIMSFSFLSVNYTLSPYSIAINLQVLSILNFVKSSKSSSNSMKKHYIVISAIFFGILLNFRSDYIYFSLILPIILYYVQPVKYNVFLGLIWISITLLFLLPWMLYTKSSIGKSLLTSTNSGHVFFIGLGNLPNNKWNITTSDLDPKMYNELRNKYGPSTLSYRYKEDLFLKKRFFELIQKDPLEYMNKVVYSCFQTIISGIYVPEFFNLLTPCSIKGCKEDFIDDLSNRPIESLFENSKKTVIYFLTYFSIFIGIVIILLAHIILPIMLYKAIKYKVTLNLLSTLIILYQLFINSFAYQMKLYSTYSYLWALLLLILFYTKCYNNIDRQLNDGTIG